MSTFWTVVVMFMAFCGLWAIGWAAMDDFRERTAEMARKAAAARAMAALDH